MDVHSLSFGLKCRKMDLNNMSENCRRFHYLIAVQFGEKRILRPETMKFVLGRSKCSDFVISAAKVAKKQCEIVCSGDSWMLHNLSPDGTSIVGRVTVHNAAVKIRPEDIMKIGGIYIQCKPEIESSQPPLRILKIIVLIGEKYCHLAAESENQPDEPPGRVAPENLDNSVKAIPTGSRQAEEIVQAKDDIINSLTSENEHVMKELKEMKSALRKALTDKGEAEFKAAQINDQLMVSQENSAKAGIMCEMTETELQCSICNELLIDAITVDCSHTFCEHCLVQWKKKSKICPMCRSNIRHECKTRVIDNLIERIIGYLPDETQKRRKELTESRRASKRRSRSHSRGRQNKRKRMSVIELADPVHEVVRISLNYTNVVNETIDLSSDDDIF